MKVEALEECFCGAVTVGERGQVVIPAEARKKLGIQAGDKLFVMSHPTNEAIVLFKIETVREMLSLLMEGLTKVEMEMNIPEPESPNGK